MKRIVLVAAWLTAALSVRAQSPETLALVRLNHPDLQDPRAVAVDPFGSIYVVDAGRYVVLKLSSSGTLLATLGGPGSREGEFDGPADVDPTNGMAILVADAGNGRIQWFSRSLAYLGSIPLTLPDRRQSADPARVTYRRRDENAGAYASGRPIAIASAGANELFAIDGDRNVVVKLDDDRKVVRVFGDHDSGAGAMRRPVAIAGGEGLIYVADAGREAVLVYDLFGTYIRAVGEGRLTEIRAVAVDGNHVIVALPRGILVFGPGGLEKTLTAPDELRDVAVLKDGSLLVLTATALHQATVR